MRFIALTLAIVCFTVCSLRAEVPDKNPISDDAIATIKQVQAAYDGLQSLEVHGTIADSTKVHDLVVSSSRKFDGQFVAPNRFRIEIEPRMTGNANDLCGCTGKLVYSDTGNHTARAAADAADGKLGLPRMLMASGETENLSPMALAAFKGTALQLVHTSIMGAKTVKCDADERIGDTPCLKIVSTETLPAPRRRTLYFDRNTHLLRREIDETDLPGGGSSRQVIDVETTKINPQIPDDQFKWKPPAEWIDPNSQPAAPAPPVVPAPAPGAT
jgi:outer membrane lipoprotein-sorting protein